MSIIMKWFSPKTKQHRQWSVSASQHLDRLRKFSEPPQGTVLLLRSAWYRTICDPGLHAWWVPQESLWILPLRARDAANSRGPRPGYTTLSRSRPGQHHRPTRTPGWHTGCVLCHTETLEDPGGGSWAVSSSNTLGHDIPGSYSSSPPALSTKPELLPVCVCVCARVHSSYHTPPLYRLRAVRPLQGLPFTESLGWAGSGEGEIEQQPSHSTEFLKNELNQTKL